MLNNHLRAMLSVRQQCIVNQKAGHDLHRGPGVVPPRYSAINRSEVVTRIESSINEIPDVHEQIATEDLLYLMLNPCGLLRSFDAGPIAFRDGTRSPREKAMVCWPSSRGYLASL
jgi:hypothetical protein